MKIPTVEYCCCGLSLKLGTLLIGIFAFVGSLGAFTNTLDTFYIVNEVADHPELDDPHIDKIREHLFAIQMYVYMSFLVTVTGAILSAVLLMGYFTSNRSMLRAWVIGDISVHVISLFANIFMSILFEEYLYLAWSLFVFLNLYFACVVNSYAQEIIKGSSSSIA